MKHNGRKQPVTVMDVAARAGVSIKTVSRVINDEPYVGEATRQLVQRAIRELNYHPNRAARRLASHHSRVIGLLVPSIANPFFPLVIQGVTRVMHEQGYDVLIYSTDVEVERSRKGLKLLAENHADGVIVCSLGGLDDTELETFISQYSAAVLVNMVLPGIRAGVVRVDSARGMEILVNHVVASGRRTLAFLNYPIDKHSTSDRLRGYREALVAHGLPFDEELVVRSKVDSESVDAATRTLLRLRPDVDAILCYNDLMAGSVLRTCMEMGVVVPDQIAVTGFDNVPFTDLFKQSLTTVNAPKLELGIKAAEMLLGRLNGDFTISELVITPELIIRESAP